MKHIIQRIVALALVAALCLTAMPSAFAVQPADAVSPILPYQYAQVDVLWDEITQLENQTMLAQSTDSVASVDIQSVADYVQDSDLYIDGSLRWNGSDAFTFMTSAGVRCKYSLRLRQQIRDASAPKTAPTADTQRFSYTVKGGSPNAADVYLIQPYYGIDNSFTTQYVNEAKTIASATGGTCTVYQRNDATIDAVADAMSNGAVVIFDSHGDTDYAHGEDYTTGATTSYLCLQSGSGITNQDYLGGNAVDGGSYGSMRYYLVNGTAIANHMKKDNPHGMLWMAICLSMATDGLQRPLRERGVEVAYGYSQSVTFDGDYMYEKAFWQNMRNGKTVAEAVANMKADYGDWDPAYYEYSFSQALRNDVAFPIVVSSEDPYPGHGKVDNYQTVNSTWTLLGSPYKVTVRSADETMGTATLAGNSVIATPNKGFYTVGATVEPADAATVTRNGDRFVLSDITADCTVTVSFAAKTPATVTYSVPNGVTQAPTQTYLNDTITLPQPTGAPLADAHSYQFLGWTTQPVQDSTAAPTVYPAGSDYTVKADTTLYALYTYRVSTTGETGYALVDATQSDWTGEYIICGNNTHVLRADGSVTGALLATDGAVTLDDAGLTLSEDYLDGEGDSYVYQIEKVDDYYTIRMGMGEAYLALNTNSNSLTTADTADADNAHWTISYSNGQSYLFNVKYQNRRLQFNTDTEEFRCYSSAKAPIRLYRAQQMVRYYTTQPQNQQHVHNFVATVTPPTCTEDGYTTYTCTCGESYIADETPALGHNYVAAVTPPTCTEGGFTTYTCSACGESHVGDETDALGHDFGEWTLTTPPTAHETGEETRTCTRCDATQTRTVDATGCPSEKFTDVNTDLWYHNAIDFAVSNGLLVGVTDTTFAPNAPTTRAMLVSVLWRMEGQPDASTETKFTDVDLARWYARAVSWAAENKIVAGVSETAFAPNAQITREQVAAILYRYSRYKGYATDASGSLERFTDAQSCSSYAVPALQWAVGAGILNGMTDGSLAPKGQATRAQIAQMMMKFSALPRG